jgi:hypothetical protein
MITVEYRRGISDRIYRGTVYGVDRKIIATFSVGSKEFATFKQLFVGDVEFKEVQDHGQ